ncbi:MAG: hypothetical protein J6V53_00850 [Alphaproteobacteria bacterium]|nr:hypothetical protein [Alphaproteobacteria bacterium]
MRLIYCLLICLSIIGCSAARQQFNKQSLLHLKGEPAQKVIDLLGPPNIQVQEGSVTKLIYQTNYKTYTPPTSEIYLSGGNYQQGQYLKSSCILTFIIEEKRVTDVFDVGNCL